MLQAGHSSLQLRKLDSDAEVRCRDGRSWRAILKRHDDDAASILKSDLEIKNQCTQEEVNGENLASIPKSGPEIKNRCTQEDLNRENLASIRKSGLEIKNRCTKQPIFSTHPQQIPRHAFKRASCLGRFAWGGLERAQAGLTVAAKAGADAPGGGISLCFCRRGCAAPAQKAATLNTLTAAPAQKAATLNDPRRSSRHAKSRDLRGAIWPESSLLWR